MYGCDVENVQIPTIIKNSASNSTSIAALSGKFYNSCLNGIHIEEIKGETVVFTFYQLMFSSVYFISADVHL
jgi:hypothetical protein